MNKAVFLDRDGVINHDPGDYTKSWEEFRFNDHVMEALKAFQDAGFLLIIVTNQGGIAKGLYSLEEYDHLSEQMLKCFDDEGIRISEVYFSPHHEVTGKSLTRKPGSLLVERGIARFEVDPSSSFIIGDKERDIFAGEKAGLTGIQIPVNSSLLDVKDRILNHS